MLAGLLVRWMVGGAASGPASAGSIVVAILVGVPIASGISYVATGFWRDRAGFLWSERFWFAGTGCPPVQFSRVRYGSMLYRHQEGAEPIPVVYSGTRQWWWWQDAFYWETGDYEAGDVKALLFQRERRKQRELEHAHTLMAVAETGERVRKRDPIPEAVKLAVFRRDEDRCQEGGSTELIQYDHIIPFSMGGSNEVENLQLLCAPCNRAKGGRL
jgi:hypothetical protein